MKNANKLPACIVDFDSLEIRKVERQKLGGSGTWVIGCVDGHAFEALVFPEHAAYAEYEIEQSRISKLSVSRLSDRREVYCWDRGLDVPVQTPAAASIVAFLCDGLADFVYPTSEVSS